MAIPSTAGWQQKILEGLGAPASPQALRFFDAWQRAEGGSYANNPFNTTLKTAAQVGDPNSAGVRGYASPEAGIQATIETLKNGYYDPIVAGLRSGASAESLAKAVASSPWGTGGGVLRVLGAGPSVAPPSPAPPALSVPTFNAPAAAAPPRTISIPREPDLAPFLMSGLSPGSGLSSLVGAVAAAGPITLTLPGTETSSGKAPKATPGAKPSTPWATPLGNVKVGDPIPLGVQTSVGGEHETAGLAGYPAHDYMAPAGAPVVAPVTGKIVRFSGHDPRNGPTDGVHGPFGWSLYIAGDDGRNYYLTHLGSRDVKVGQKVEAGQPIGTVGNYAAWGGADHVHMGVNA